MKTLTVALGERSYPIYIGSGLLDRPDLLTGHVKSRQVLVVTNQIVAPLYLERVRASLEGYRCETIVLPDGEEYKNMATLMRIFDALLGARFDRGVTLIALGGGVIGDITAKRLNVLREVDDLLIEEIKKAGYYKKLWQSFAVLLPIKSVGVMGDARTYEDIVAIRAVTSRDAMTADWAKLPHTFLAHVSNRIINEVKGVNRVVYDISSKPPSTIEWE